MTIWRRSDFFCSLPSSAGISLGEGNTPLIRSRKIGPAAGLKNLFFKLETSNPCGSFKDRFGSSAISHMAARDQHTIVATSSGNTGAALAGYAAAAGMRCRIAVVETAPEGKLKQMLAYGAEVFRVRGFGLDAHVTTEVLNTLKELGERPGSALQVSAYVYSPDGMSGCETISLELSEQSESPVEHVFCPAGGGGLCVAAARGFEKLVASGAMAASPAVHCVQPEGNDTIASPLRAGDEEARPIACTTKISGLQVASVVDGHLAVQACRASGGTGHLVNDEEVWQVQKRLAVEEGVFAEPAGSVALAGALNAAANNELSPDAMIVCLITGTGFKDDAAVDRMIADAPSPMLTLEEFQQNNANS